jgi:hypothetical protein
MAVLIDAVIAAARGSKEDIRWLCYHSSNSVASFKWVCDNCGLDWFCLREYLLKHLSSLDTTGLSPTKYWADSKGDYIKKR